MLSQAGAFFFLLLFLDFLWISVTNSMHQAQVSAVQHAPLEFDWVAGILFYVVAAVAFHVFIKNSRTPIWHAFLLGLCMYATFDLTNKAIFKDFQWSYALSDMLWGASAFAFATYFITSF